MSKYGFVRWPEKDFTQDGIKKYVYRTKEGKRVQIIRNSLSKNASDYCWVRVRVYEAHPILNRADCVNLPHFRYLDALHNNKKVAEVTDADFTKLYNDCVEYEKEYNEKEKEIIEQENSVTEEQVKARMAEEKKTAIADIKKATKYLSEHFEELYCSGKVPELDLIGTTDCFKQCYDQIINRDNSDEKFIEYCRTNKRVAYEYVHKNRTFGHYNLALYSNLVVLVNGYLK